MKKGPRRPLGQDAQRILGTGHCGAAVHQLVTFRLDFYVGSKPLVADVRVTSSPDARVTVGRLSNNDVSLPHASVSRHHATIFVKGEGPNASLWLRDEGTTNGSRVNGRRFRNEEAALPPNARVSVGVVRVETHRIESKSAEMLTFEEDEEFGLTTEFDPNLVCEPDLASERLKTLYRFATDSLDYDTERLVLAAGDTIAETLPFDQLCILIQTNHGLQVAVSRTPEGPCPIEQTLPSGSLVAFALKKRRGLLATTSRHDDSVSACAPLFKSRVTYGAIIMTRAGNKEYESGDLEFLSLLATNVVNGLASRRAFYDLECATRRAQEANRAKNHFLANISHELRTPLAGVIGMTQILLDSQLTTEQTEHANIVKQSADILLGVIDDVIDVARIEEGGVRQEVTDFDLAKVFEEVAGLFAAPAYEKDLQTIITCPAEVPRRLRGDRARIAKILTNLLGNAVKFTEVGELELSAELLEEHEASASIRLSVRDTGIGVPPDKLKCIFERFMQVDDSHSRRFGGVGLGLTICGQLAELLGSRIDVESTPDVGSTFWLDLTIEKGTATTDGDAESALSGSVTGRPTRSLRVLVAEDNLINQKIACRMIEGLGHSVDVAADGREAVERVKATRYDLVFMDIQMPFLDGYEATVAIRRLEEESGEHLPVVALTAHALGGERERCLGCGMDEYLTKPIDRDHLRATLEHFAALVPVEQESSKG